MSHDSRVRHADFTTKWNSLADPDWMVADLQQSRGIRERGEM
jgi:hypothetical protein